MTRHQKTFLLTEEWMTIPWRSQPKTWRDRLYDLIICFSEGVARPWESGQTSSSKEVIRTAIDEALRIEARLSMWRSSWLNETYPNLQITCNCGSLAPFSCICSVPTAKFPAIDFALLQVECWSLQLLISTRICKLLLPGIESATLWTAHFPLRSSQIASHLEAVSTFPALRHTTERSSGVTEGFCRTILSTWTLRVYKDTVTACNA